MTPHDNNVVRRVVFLHEYSGLFNSYPDLFAERVNKRLDGVSNGEAGELDLTKGKLVDVFTIERNEDGNVKLWTFGVMEFSKEYYSEWLTRNK